MRTDRHDKYEPGTHWMQKPENRAKLQAHLRKLQAGAKRKRQMEKANGNHGYRKHTNKRGAYKHSKGYYAKQAGVAVVKHQQRQNGHAPIESPQITQLDLNAAYVFGRTEEWLNWHAERTGVSRQNLGERLGQALLAASRREASRSQH